MWFWFWWLGQKCIWTSVKVLSRSGHLKVGGLLISQSLHHPLRQGEKYLGLDNIFENWRSLLDEKPNVFNIVRTSPVSRTTKPFYVRSRRYASLTNTDTLISRYCGMPQCWLRGGSLDVCLCHCIPKQPVTLTFTDCFLLELYLPSHTVGVTWFVG